jgi:A/G-specific adenine glycosylase
VSLPCKPAVFSQKVLRWFAQHGRHDLPWQNDKNAYRVWLSEIMLQQTQVTTVIPYFLHFTQHYPDIKSLANAHIDNVLSLWSGLGYYQRARNLWKTAQIIHQQFNNLFPEDIETLQTLPGIGRSTAGAIASIAFEQRAAILDGNVRRVLSRFCAVDGNTQSPEFMNTLWNIAEQYTPLKNNADYTQAMMDLGATLCTRSKPQCEQCPLKTHCRAYHMGKPTEYPERRIKKSLLTEKVFFLVIHNAENKILLQKRSSPGIWGGLWCFPQFFELRDLKNFAKKSGILIPKTLTPTQQLHTFTHKRWDMHFYSIIQKSKKNMPDNNTWHPQANILKLGLPAPIKQYLNEVIYE